ncbi:MAG: hypothetical protein U1F68_08960 [Gammaproteobacteria bacterium]
MVRTYAEWLAEDRTRLLLRHLNSLIQEQQAKGSGKLKTSFKSHFYDFGTFGLNTDDSGFYCSKLAWLSIYRSLGFAVDGDENPNRMLLVLAKAISLPSTIERLHDQGHTHLDKKLYK